MNTFKALIFIFLILNQVISIEAFAKSNKKLVQIRFDSKPEKNENRAPASEVIQFVQIGEPLSEQELLDPLVENKKAAPIKKKPLAPDAEISKDDLIIAN